MKKTCESNTSVATAGIVCDAQLPCELFLEQTVFFSVLEKVIDTARIIFGAGSMKRLRSIVRLSVPSFDRSSGGFAAERHAGRSLGDINGQRRAPALRRNGAAAWRCQQMRAVSC